MFELSVDHDEMSVLSGENTFSSPDYCTKLLHLANQDLPDKKPDFASRICEINDEKDLGHELDWNSWYYDQTHESEEDAVKRMMTMLNELKKSIDGIDENTVKHFVHDQLITDSYLGMKIKEAILMKVSVNKNTFYEIAKKGQSFDGYIGKVPVLVQPLKNRQDDLLDEGDIRRIFYTKEKNGIKIYIDF